MHSQKPESKYQSTLTSTKIDSAGRISEKDLEGQCHYKCEDFTEAEGKKNKNVQWTIKM